MRSSSAVEVGVTSSPRRPALRYYGGKWRIAPWIIANFPPHRCYVEPFGGAASVLLRKPPAPAEVYNDLDGDVVSFFRTLREHPAEIIRAIELTPFAREEFVSAQSREGLDEIERARRVYVACCQGRAGLRGNRTGWRHCLGNGRTTTAAHEFAAVDHLVARGSA